MPPNQMMSCNSNKRVANAVGGKTARACDSCIKKRARWYCAADDAFLCQACDSSVHSANQLARRHERVRLNTSSLFNSLDFLVISKEIRNKKVASWHQGFTRKARTPRQGKPSKTKTNEDYFSRLLRRKVSSLVPELGSDDHGSHEENQKDQDHQLLYSVPIYDDHFVAIAQLCSDSNSKNSTVTSGISSVPSGGDHNSEHLQVDNGKGDLALFPGNGKEGEKEEEEDLKGILAGASGLADFASDVGCLLGRGLEDESCFGMEELGITIGSKEENGVGPYFENKVKFEEEGTRIKECKIDFERGWEDPFKLSFNYRDYNELPETSGVDDEDEELDQKFMRMEDEKEFIKKNSDGVEDGLVKVKKKNKNKSKNKNRKDILLRLDYDAVISAWGSSRGGSPWTTGCRPDFGPDEFWSDCFEASVTEVQHQYGEHTNITSVGGGQQAIVLGDGGREARVSRYREKRRTRLFSKKIRYEVRKLNAEKKPRMKGRFVKRATFAGPAFPLLNN